MIDHFTLVQQALAQLDHSAVQRAIDIIKAAKQRGSMVFICGNGGSAATASHFACDLQKAAGVRAIALTDNVPLITAWANDLSYANVFEAQFANLFYDEDDVIVLISCSGKSENIQKIFKCFSNPSIAMLGFGLGLFPGLTTKPHVNIAVESVDYGVIEDIHLSICHAITKGVASE